MSNVYWRVILNGMASKCVRCGLITVIVHNNLLMCWRWMFSMCINRRKCVFRMLDVIPSAIFARIYSAQRNQSEWSHNHCSLIHKHNVEWYALVINTSPASSSGPHRTLQRPLRRLWHHQQQPNNNDTTKPQQQPQTRWSRHRWTRPTTAWFFWNVSRLHPLRCCRMFYAYVFVQYSVGASTREPVRLFCVLVHVREFEYPMFTLELCVGLEAIVCFASRSFVCRLCYLLVSWNFRRDVEWEV